jgi:carbohydrate kinase (thermoresistant glucokinase family)
MFILIMGVTGSGKTTVGTLLAADLGWPYLDADNLHSPANIRKMALGIALTDDDREPWLGLLSAKVAEAHARGEHGIVACSALKEAYRASLLSAAPTTLVYLKATPDLIRARLANRPDHFMPASLIDSQFRDLEEPGVGITISADRLPGEIVKRIRAELQI